MNDTASKRRPQLEVKRTAEAASDHGQDGSPALTPDPPERSDVDGDGRAAEGPVEPGQRHPPGLAGGQVAAGKRDRLEPGEALEAVVVREQELPAPGRSVLAVAVAVEGHAEDAAPGNDPVLEERGQDVGEVVLDAEVGDTHPGGVSRRPEIGVEVGDDGRRPGVEETQDVGQGLLEIAEVPVIVEVAQELAGDDVAVLVEGDRVLELAAEGDDDAVGAELFRDGLGMGNIAAGAADEERAARDDLDDRVIGPHGDRAVVGRGRHRRACARLRPRP